MKLKLPAEIFAFSRCMVEDVKRAVDTGVKGIVMEVPSSEHIIEYAYRWSLEKAIETSIEATRYAKAQGLYVVFFPIDASRAEMGWYLKTIERVATEGHMDALALVDTFGVLSPHAVEYLVRKTQERITKPLETHFHMDFGMGVAEHDASRLADGAGSFTPPSPASASGPATSRLEDTLLALLTHVRGGERNRRPKHGLTEALPVRPQDRQGRHARQPRRSSATTSSTSSRGSSRRG